MRLQEPQRGRCSADPDGAVSEVEPVGLLADFAPDHLPGQPAIELFQRVFDRFPVSPRNDERIVESENSPAEAQFILPAQQQEMFPFDEAEARKPRPVMLHAAVKILDHGAVRRRDLQQPLFGNSLRRPDLQPAVFGTDGKGDPGAGGANR